MFGNKGHKRKQRHTARGAQREAVLIKRGGRDDEAEEDEDEECGEFEAGQEDRPARAGVVYAQPLRVCCFGEIPGISRILKVTATGRGTGTLPFCRTGDSVSDEVAAVFVACVDSDLD